MVKKKYEFLVVGDIWGEEFTKKNAILVNKKGGFLIGDCGMKKK